MSRFFYTLLYCVLTPLLFLRLLIKHQKSSAYKEQRQSLRLGERFGFFKKTELTIADVNDKDTLQASVWFHTVSVGEFIATLPLIKQIRRDYPQHPLVITCTTTTGSAQITKTFVEEIESGQIFHVYLPYDLPGSMKRFLKSIQPCLGIIMETEIWPNLLHTAHQMNIPMWLLNARMSEKSAKGYARFPKLSREALQKLSGIAAQNVMDANRLKELGANEHSLYITGSIKFDLKINPENIHFGSELRAQLNWQAKTVLIAASTHKGEDEIIQSVYKNLRQQHPNLVMILVPRHPERFQPVYQQLNNGDFEILKRSEMNNGSHTNVDILLGDSMGEMMSFFACSDVVFMGGTIVSTGGHNILEPAALGLPIVYGPYMFNFTAINELFLQHKAAQQVPDAESLINALNTLLLDMAEANQMGERAKKLMQKNSGAMDKMITLLTPYLK